VHDENGFTIIQDLDTGFWCWAVHSTTRMGDVQSSGYPTHLHSPQSLGLEPRINISEQRYIEKRTPFDIEFSERDTRTPTTGTVNNLVVFIRFSDQTDFTWTPTHMTNTFNNQTAGANSLYRYFFDASYQQLQINSHFYPIPTASTVLSYQSPHPRNYFMPFHATTNTIGFSGGDNGTERRDREHALLRDAIIHVRDQVPTNLNIDANNDGRVDNVVFMIRGASGAWASLLWSHRWSLFSLDVRIHGKRVWDYNFNMEDSFDRPTSGGVGLLVHEFGHSLGAPDFYRYTNTSVVPIGMGSDVKSNKSTSIYDCSY
jgi:M6 family metalloprotease-like protein